MKKGSGRVRVVVSGALGLAAWAAGCSGGPGPETSAPSPVATIQTVEAGRGTVTEALETFGTVEFDPDRINSVAFDKSGQIVRVLVAAGQVVTEGERLLDLGPVPPSSREAQKARIALDFARRDLERLRGLLDRHLATNDQVQQAERAVADAQAELDGFGLTEAASQLTALRSPYPGVVVDPPPAAGTIVSVGEQAFLLAPAKAVVVRAGFEIENAPQLEPGCEVTLEPVFDAPGAEPAKARLTQLHQVVHVDTQLVEALIRPGTVPDWMLAGTTVRVHVVVHSAGDVVRLPRDAVLHRDGQTGVFVIEKDHARWQPVRIGIENDEEVQVVSGVAEGDRVATTGRSSLVDGIAVKIEAAGPG